MGYNDSSWGDRLTSWQGTTITYDEIGNPTWYSIDYLTCLLTWNGRQLTSFENMDGLRTYTYNDEGIRIAKNDRGTLHTYQVDGIQIVSETWGIHTIFYVYDENGSIAGMRYRTSTYAEGVFDEYLFEKNLQGDVVAIYNASGIKLVSYTYDAWGKVTTTYSNGGASTPARFNPFKYRGYYHDSDTNLYYLNSRYYDPGTGRFISADGYVSTGQGIIGNNMYAYCNNNPINGSDPCGTCFHHWKFWKDCAKCAASKAAKKALEVAQTIKYDVPLYKQGNLSLCWAFCQTMMESYNSGTTLTQKEAKARAIEIAQAYHGSTMKKVWNQGGWPSNLGERIGNIDSIEELYNILQDNGPVYAYYSNEKNAHIVIVTGVNLYRGVVYTNNPWGVSGAQSFEEFQNGFATKWYHFSSRKSASGAIIYLMN